MPERRKTEPKDTTPVVERGPRFDEVLGSEDLLKWLWKCRTIAKAYCDEQHAETDYFWRVRAGEALSAEDRAVLLETQRPLIDPPFAAGVLDAVLGMEIAADVSIAFRGVDSGFEDGVVADWLSLLVKNGWTKAGIDGKLLEAYDDDLVGGSGFVQFYLDMHRVPFRIACRHLEYWQVWWEPASVEPNYRDATYFGIEADWRREDAESNWQEAWQRAAITRAAKRSGGRRSAPGGDPLPLAGGAGRIASQLDDQVRIIEFSYRRGVARVHYADPEVGEEVDSTREDYEKRKADLNRQADAAEAAFEEELAAWESVQPPPDTFDAAPQQPPPQPPEVLRIDENWELENAHFYNGYAYRRAFVVGEHEKTATVLEDKEIDLPLPGDEPGFTLRAVTGYAWRQREKKQVRRYGLMRKIVHIQEWFTRAIRQYLEQQSRKIKGGGTAEPRCFQGIPGGFDEFARKISAGGHWQLIADGTKDGINPWPAASGEPGLVELISMMREMFGWVTGMSQGLQGTLTADRANVLVENQQEHGLQMLLPIRQPRRDFLLSCGRLYAAIAVKHLPAEEIDRILGVQEVEGMTVERVMGPDGRPVIGPNGKPQMQPILSREIGPDDQPVPLTAGRILKAANLLDFDVEADIAQAQERERTKVMVAIQQHGLGAVLERMLPGPGGAKIWIGELFKAMWPSAATGKAMAAKAEVYLTQMEQQQSLQGITEAFRQMAASDPEQAGTLLQQLVEIMGGGEEQEAA